MLQKPKALYALFMMLNYNVLLTRQRAVHEKSKTATKGSTTEKGHPLKTFKEGESVVLSKLKTFCD